MSLTFRLKLYCEKGKLPMRIHKQSSQSALLFAMAASVLISSSCSSDSLDIDSVISEFSIQIQRDVEQDNVGSISFGISQYGKTIYSDAFGLMDRETLRPARPDHIYRTGSISKSITAVLMMLLVQDGLLNLDDPVSKFLPEIETLQNTQRNNPTVSLRHLASHTSGLIREPDLEEAASGSIETWEDKILTSIKHTYFQAEPGEEYSYSNIGYGILGLALSRAANMPFIDLVESRIFQPLGMSSTTFIIDDKTEDLLASGYVYREGIIDGTIPFNEHSGRGYKVPNGGVYSTVADLATFSEFMTGGEPRLLSENLRKSMMSIQTPESVTEGYGLGFSLSQNGSGVWWISHGGSVAGYNAYLLFQPDSQLSIVLLRNYSGGVTDLGRAARNLGDKLLATTQ